MSGFKEYVLKHKVELVRRSTVLEGYMFTHLDTVEILGTGKSSGKDLRRVREVVNLNRAWDWVLSTKGFYPLILEDLHEIVSDDVTSDRLLEGYMRPARKEVTISGTWYVPPKTERVQSLNEYSVMFGRLYSYVTSRVSLESKVDAILSFYLYLMKRQFFHDCNKRTAYIFTNYLFKEFEMGIILYLPALSSEGTFLKYLKNFYESEDILHRDRFVQYLKRYYIKRTCGS